MGSPPWYGGSMRAAPCSYEILEGGAGPCPGISGPAPRRRGPGGGGPPLEAPGRGVVATIGILWWRRRARRADHRHARHGARAVETEPVAPRSPIAISERASALADLAERLAAPTPSPRWRTAHLGSGPRRGARTVDIGVTDADRAVMQLHATRAPRAGQTRRRRARSRRRHGTDRSGPHRNTRTCSPVRRRPGRQPRREPAPPSRSAPTSGWWAPSAGPGTDRSPSTPTP